jgi:hypothetical protein
MLVEMIIWFWTLFKAFRKLPDIKKRIAEQKSFNKYLPK